MTPDDPLQALHPLREPPAVGWWPPAPGWWILAALLLAGVLLLITWAWRRRRRNRYRRQAIAALQALRSAALPDSERVQQTNAILKRTALAAYPAGAVAALGGVDWIQFLQRTLPGNRQAFADISSDIFYTPEPPPEMTDAFTDAALSWVRQHRRESGNA